ncbi:MAG: hypothetical protein HYW79_00760 [Parcubacteria group bacterium]|nr:hypothetical protein [Parcubacteria group bacterium]
MNENLPKSETNEESEKHLLSDAKRVINSMWKKAMDAGDLPLSVDPSYQVWLEDLEKRKSEFARVLFNKARESVGEDKLRSAQTLKHLMELLNNSERHELLKELMTTDEAIQKLIADAEQQVRSK